MYHRYFKDSEGIAMANAPTAEQLAQLALVHEAEANLSPRVALLVSELIGRVADKWMMIIVDILAEHGELRFTRIGKLAPGISQKMLTQTLRLMERDGLVVRTVRPVIPPHVEYKLTDMGLGLALAFCGVWEWAAKNIERIEGARLEFERRRPALA
jgi:DNA-binding HxlR family transcriptional regulator